MGISKLLNVMVNQQDDADYRPIFGYVGQMALAVLIQYCECDV